MKKFLTAKQRKLLTINVVRSQRGELRPEVGWRDTVTWKEFRKQRLWDTTRGTMDIHYEPTEESISVILRSMQESEENFRRLGLDAKIRPYFVFDF